MRTKQQLLLLSDSHKNTGDTGTQYDMSEMIKRTPNKRASHTEEVVTKKYKPNN